MSSLSRRLGLTAGRMGRKSRSEKRGNTRRQFLQGERLENRCMLAGDLSPFQNQIIPTDVNLDFHVSPIDALIVINRLNNGGAGKLSAPTGEGSGEAPELVDVNGDGYVSPVDVLHVINALNGEGAGEVIGLRLQVTDANNNPITSVGIGGTFKLRGFVKDLRSFPTQPTGVFSFFSDVEVTNYSNVSIVFGETQELRLGNNTTGGSFTLSVNSQTQTVSIVAGDNFQSVTNKVQAAVDALYGAGNARVVRKPFDDPENDANDNGFIWHITFQNALAEQPVTNMTANGSGLTVTSGSPSAVVTELHPADPNNAGTFASSFVFDFGRSAIDYTVGNTARQVTGLGTGGANGRIDEIGGAADVFNITDPNIRGDEFLFFEGTFHANSAGTVTFQGDRPDDSVSDILFFNNANEVDPNMVDYGQAVTLQIVNKISAVNDNLTVNEDSLASNIANRVNVLQNDSLIAGTQKRLNSFGQGTSGTVTRFDNGTPTNLTDDQLIYQPNSNFFGNDAFTYVIANELGDTATATVNVTVREQNDAPVPTTDNHTMVEGSTATIAVTTVTNNDSPGPNETGQSLTITNVATTTGTVSLNGGNIIYTPPGTFNGTATVTYVVTDNGTTNGAADPKSATGTINITVTDVNDPPTAGTDNLTTPEDTARTVTATILTSNDSPGPGESTQTLTIVSVSAASQQGGAVSLSGGNVIYSPPSNYFGPDSFTYVVQDNGVPAPLTATGTVNVTVTPVNDAPDAVNDGTTELGTIDELTTNNQLNVLANDSAGPNEGSTDAIRVVAVGTSPNSMISIGANGANVVYTPNPTFTGTDTFTYTIRDNGGLEDTATVSIEVVPVVRPRAVTDRPTFPEGSSNNLINVRTNDLPNLNPTETIKLKSFTAVSTGTLTFDDNGTPGNLTDDTFRYTPPDPDFNGVATFTYVINDTREDNDPQNAGADSTGTVSITITEANDDPTAASDNLNATEDTPRNIAGNELTGNDSKGPANENGQTLTVVSADATSANGGMVSVSGGNLEYTPGSNFNGVDTFKYVVRDNGKTNGADDFKTSTGTVTITVAAVNDAPIATNDSATTNEDTTATIAISTLTSNDRPGPQSAGDELSGQQVVFGAASGLSARGGTITQNGGNLLYTPPGDFSGTDTFTYTITDNGPAPNPSVTGTVTVTVNAVNDPPRPGVTPTPGDDQVIAFKNQNLTITVSTLLTNDSPGPADEAGQTLSVQSVSSSTALGGMAVLSADGRTIVYTPPQDQAGVHDTITYVIQDSGSPAATTTATIDVDLKNFQPSTVSGFVWLDVDNQGDVDAVERRLAGIDVHLTGTDFANQPVNRMTTTGADGSYSFGNVSPGHYVLSAMTPAFVRDGKDTPGSLGDSDSVNDQFTFDIVAPGGVNASGYNFGELGISTQYASILELLASTPGEGGFAAIGANGGMQWSSNLGGYSGVKFTEFVMNAAHTRALLTIVDQNNQVSTAELDASDFNYQISDSGDTLIRFNGDRSSHNFQVVNRSNPPARPEYADYLDAVDDFFANMQ